MSSLNPYNSLVKPDKISLDFRTTKIADAMTSDALLITDHDFKSIRVDDNVRYMVEEQSFNPVESYCSVFTGYDKVIGRGVKIKMANKECCRRTNIIDEKSYSYFVFNEARILAMLDHPNIVKIYDFAATNFDELVVPCLVEELLHGVSMENQNYSFEKSSEKISLSELLDYLDDIADALDYTHTQKIVHGDVKPGNFVMDIKKDKDSQIIMKRGVLIDFGIARRIGVDKRFKDLFPDLHWFSDPYVSPFSREEGPSILGDRWSYVASIKAIITGRFPYGVDEYGDPELRGKHPEYLVKCTEIKALMDNLGKDKCQMLDLFFENVLNGQNLEQRNCKAMIKIVRLIIEGKTSELRNFVPSA